MPYCLGCGSMIDEYDSAYYARNMLCIPCWNRKASEVPMATCGKCGMRVRQDESRQRRGTAYCHYCFSELERTERLPACPICRKRMEYHEKQVRSSDGKEMHSSCAQKEQGKVRVRCSYCGEETSYFRISKYGSVMCMRCSEKEGRRAEFTEPAEEAGSGGLFARVVDKLGSMLG